MYLKRLGLVISLIFFGNISLSTSSLAVCRFKQSYGEAEINRSTINLFSTVTTGLSNFGDISKYTCNSETRSALMVKALDSAYEKDDASSFLRTLDESYYMGIDNLALRSFSNVLQNIANRPRSNSDEYIKCILDFFPSNFLEFINGQFVLDTAALCVLIDNYFLSSQKDAPISISTSSTSSPGHLSPSNLSPSNLSSLATRSSSAASSSSLSSSSTALSSVASQNLASSVESNQTSKDSFHAIAIDSGDQFLEIINNIKKSNEDVSYLFFMKTDFGMVGVHRTPIFVRKKNGRYKIMISDSVGNQGRYKGMAEEMMREVFDEVDKREIYSSNILRQRNDNTCPVFSFEDSRYISQNRDRIFEFAEEHKKAPPPRTGLKKNKTLPPYKNLWELDVLPPTMMLPTQSLSQLDSYMKTVFVNEEDKADKAVFQKILDENKFMVQMTIEQEGKKKRITKAQNFYLQNKYNQYVVDVVKKYLSFQSEKELRKYTDECYQRTK